MKQPVSIVIRARNEREQLERLFDMLERQDYLGQQEIVVVDSESTDGTREMAEERGAKVVTIKQAEFSYPKSMNMGVAAASNALVVLTVAHALPFRVHWLRRGLAYFENPKVAGVYAPVRPGPRPTHGDRLLHLPGYLASRAAGPKAVEANELALFAATNVAFRKSLWQQHHFDESFGAGGEDGEWAAWAIGQGYIIMREPEFSVYHSHGLSIAEAKQQFNYYSKLGEPHPFDANAVVKKGRLDG